MNRVYFADNLKVLKSLQNECGAVTKIKPKKVIEQELPSEQINRPWYKTSGSRIGYLDIEADGIKADFSTMLSWCIKQRDGEIYYDVITQEDIQRHKGDADKRIITSLMNTLSIFSVVVAILVMIIVSIYLLFG